MALSPQLLQFKSSGVYRLEFDKSQTVNIPAETIRLVVGHSKKGPYNTPVLVETAEQFINAFGNIDRNLEKKGMFFHRSVLNALNRGPVLALNLADLTSATASYAAPVTNGSVDGIAAIESSDSYGDFFNTEKFWTPSDDALNAVVGTAQNNLIRFVNIKQDPITVFVRKAQDVRAFEITAREWYGDGNVPAFMNDFDFIADYMVDVFVFKGAFDPAVMDTDPVYGSFFNADGLFKSQLNAFSNLREVSLIAQYTGSIIPGFTDLEGNMLYVETMINAEARRTGLFCAINETAVLDETGTKADLVGHVYDKDQDYELLSYLVDQNVTATTVTIPAGVTAVTVNPTDLVFAGGDLTSILAAGDFLESVVPGEYVEITSVVFAAGDTTVTVDAEAAADYALLVGGDDFDKFAVSNARAYEVSASWNYAVQTGSVVAFTYTGATAPAFDIKVGHYIQSATAGRLAKVTRVAYSTSGTGASTVHTYMVYLHAPAATSFSGYAFKSFEEATTVYKPFVLEAAVVPAQTIAGCLNAINIATGLGRALADKDNVTYRYIVDTFASLELGQLLNKVELAALAKERQNASAILNAPMVYELKASTNPSFTDSNSAFNVAYVATGGNLDKNPTALYALPSINDGANYAFFYGPGLVVRENNKDIIVPPAAYVSNNYIDKYTDSLPWAIVAGPRRGVVSGTSVVGAEYAFDKNDRDVLEPFGYNPIVFQRGVGLTILGNKTAQQSVQSALSSAHVREVLIYIQDGLANILKDYVFEFNTAQTRLEIKTLADAFMESVKADSGVFDYRNIMDSTNNTNDVIDANIGILDTFVEPVKGLEIVVHRTTILNTGEISTGNFA